MSSARRRHVAMRMIKQASFVRHVSGDKYESCSLNVGCHEPDANAREWLPSFSFLQHATEPSLMSSFSRKEKMAILSAANQGLSFRERLQREGPLPPILLRG